jgi:hypothetical protein
MIHTIEEMQSLEKEMYRLQKIIELTNSSKEKEEFRTISFKYLDCIKYLRSAANSA